MKKVLTLLFLAVSLSAIGQSGKIISHQYSQEEIDSVLTPEVRKELTIELDIYRVYEYEDKAGLHLIVMTERASECSYDQFPNPKDSIQAFCFHQRNGRWNLLWSFADHIENDEDDRCYPEYTISHWTKYFEVKDYNRDGLVDPIMVYGSFVTSSIHNRRTRILVFYKGEKRILRHAESNYDFERITYVVPEFYGLPTGILDRVTTIMEQQEENGHALFPSYWKKRMKNRELIIKE